jgi:hypothetical protein
MWKTLWDELREMIWLASVIGGLSVVGVGLAVRSRLLDDQALRPL